MHQCLSHCTSYSVIMTIFWTPDPLKKNVFLKPRAAPVNPKAAPKIYCAFNVSLEQDFVFILSSDKPRLVFSFLHKLKECSDLVESHEVSPIISNCANETKVCPEEADEAETEVYCEMTSEECSDAFQFGKVLNGAYGEDEHLGPNIIFTVECILSCGLCQLNLGKVNEY